MRSFYVAQAFMPGDADRPSLFYFSAPSGASASSPHSPLKGLEKKKRNLAIPNRRRERLGYIKGAEMAFVPLLTSR